MIDTRELESSYKRLRDTIIDVYGTFLDCHPVLSSLVNRVGNVVFYGKKISQSSSNNPQQKFEIGLNDALKFAKEIFEQKEEDYHFHKEKWFATDGGKELIETIQSQLASIKSQLDESKSTREADSTASATDISSEEDEQGIKRMRTSASKKPLV